jgi:hypothetical protein
MLIQLKDLSKHKNYNTMLKKRIQEKKGVCECCGFQSARYMRLVSVLFIEDEDTALENSKLACAICSDAYDLSRAHSKGKIVLLPELSQSELNWLVLGSWAIQSGIQSTSFDEYNDETVARKDALLKNADQLLQIIYKSRSQHVDKAFAYSTSEKYCASEPGEIADCLRRFDINTLKKIVDSELYKSLRYIPYKEAYIHERDYWASTVFSKLSYGMLNDMSKHFYKVLKESNEFRVN